MNPQDQRSDPQTNARAGNPSAADSTASAGEGGLTTEVDLLGKGSAELSPDEYEKLLGMYDDTLRDLSEGQVVKGRVVKILANEVIVDVGYKSEGMIDIDEFTTRDGLNVSEGDEIEVLLEKTENKEGYLVLSKEKAEKMKVWERVEAAYREGVPITGRIVDRIKGGLAVDIGIRAFLPGSLVDLRPVRNLDSYKGQELDMRVIKVNRRRGNIVLSRKAILEEENREKKQKTLDGLEEGKIVLGVVKNITEYGAFIDLGGLDGLLHITDMSWGRINHPSELFSIGDEVEVVVLKFDAERERVSLGYKQRTPDPWANVEERYPIGSRVGGKVVSLTDYGAFVELEEGVEGLIHVSAMSWTKRVKHPSKIVNVDETVEAMVLDLDKENRRLSLGLKQTEPNPWALIDQKYEVGSRITGKVRNLTNFGAFIEVEDGVDGLVHISDLTWSKRIKHPSEILQKGDEVEAVILKIDTENQRLSLGIKQLQPNIWDEFFRLHNVGDVLRGKVVRLTEFGAFVELDSGVEGLVHVSEFSMERVENPETYFELNDEIEVKIIKIDPTENKVGLSVKAIVQDTQTSDMAAFSHDGGGISLGDMVGTELDKRRGKSKRRRDRYDDDDD
ncbi:MAG: 30S ribosomal protein S1 [Acidobacteria bacterium]|nr:30S ribosomal protein S1 [Acidobacteriota bacterium]